MTDSVLFQHTDEDDERLTVGRTGEGLRFVASLADDGGRWLAGIDLPDADVDRLIAALVAYRQTTPDRLYGKFFVQRSDGRDLPGGDKADAAYFVLDYVHDHYARTALATYADACEQDLPGLAADLRTRLAELHETQQRWAAERAKSLAAHLRREREELRVRADDTLNAEARDLLLDDMKVLDARIDGVDGSWPVRPYPGQEVPR